LSIATMSIAIILVSSLWFVSSKEVEVTAEWALLGENDTIPAGVHVRMDMTTGEKWVKLIDEEEDEDGSSGESTTKTNVEVDAHGNVVSSSAMDPTSSVSVAVSSSTKDKDGAVVIDEDDDNNNNNHENNEPPQDLSLEDLNYDYDMMHRTLSKLPPEEQERMGLPDVPSTSKSTYAQDRQIFEQRMKDIWLARQEELQFVQEEIVADLPKLLKHRIDMISSYLEAPYNQLVELQDVDASLKGRTYEDDDDDDENEMLMTDIVLVLQDLEYHLSDLDMARDFHTLGGWPLLVSLLSTSVHEQPNTTLTEDLRSKVGIIQALASWAVGTMVKNTEDFFPFAVEKFDLAGKEVSAISLLVELLSKEDCENSTRHKVLYALGSLLRGNRLAQEEFVMRQGPQRLSDLLVGMTHGHEIGDTKLIKRILALVDDLVTDVLLHPGLQTTVEKDVLESLTTPPFCESSVALLGSVTSLNDTIVRTLHTIAPYCQWEELQEEKKGAEQWLDATLQEHRNNSEDTDDDDWLKEQTNMMESVLQALQT